MYKGHRIILIAPAFNEESKIVEVIKRTPVDIVDKILIMDDGSTDRTSFVASEAGAEVVSLPADQRGVGKALRQGYQYAVEKGYEIAVTIAGNNKDDPSEIPRLLDPICNDGVDFVVGSRYLPGGKSGGEMPAYRKIATRLHPLLVSLFVGKRLTESTNGFRALKVSVLRDKQVNLNQSWLDKYELECYLLMKLLKLGYKTSEVPASKIYPSKKIGNTKMRPIIDWWKMLSPVIYIGLGIRN